MCTNSMAPQRSFNQKGIVLRRSTLFNAYRAERNPCVTETCKPTKKMSHGNHHIGSGTSTSQCGVDGPHSVLRTSAVGSVCAKRTAVVCTRAMTCSANECPNKGLRSALLSSATASTTWRKSPLQSLKEMLLCFSYTSSASSFSAHHTQL